MGYDLKMSYTNLLYHIVYGTKDRLPLITKELRPDLHRFLGGLVKDLHGTPLVINGVTDHVHVLGRSPSANRKLNAYEITFAIRKRIIQEIHLRKNLRLS